MVLLLELPEELIEKIAELATPNDSITLRSVCRLLNAIAAPHAYRQVFLRDTSLEIASSRTLLFLRTILDRPTVGTYVRHLTAEVTEIFVRVNGPFHDEFPKFAANAASRMLSSEIEAALLRGSIGAMVFLLICHLPSLRTLDINPWSTSDLFCRQFHITPTLPSGYQSLRGITFTRGLIADLITSFLDFTNITVVHCKQAFLRLPHSAALGVGERKENRRVEVIHLEDCVTHPETLAAVVEPCRGLKSFIYRHDAMYTAVHFSAPLFMDAIRHARDSLENLELDFAFDRLHFVGSPGSLGPLCDFVALKHISASIPLLLAEPWQGPGLTTVLPPSLTSLTLWIGHDSQDRGWESVVVQLLKDKRKALPSLKKLCVECCFEYTEDEAIQAAGFRADVEVAFRSGRISPAGRDTPPNLIVADNSSDDDFIDGGDFGEVDSDEADFGEGDFGGDDFGGEFVEGDDDFPGGDFDEGDFAGGDLAGGAFDEGDFAGVIPGTLTGGDYDGDKAFCQWSPPT